MKHRYEHHFENKGKSLSKSEMRKMLKNLATEIGAGKVTVGGDTVDLIDPCYVKSRARVREGRLEYQILFEADTAGKEDIPDSEPGTDKPAAEKARGGKKGAKAIKKELKGLWKVVLPAIEAGNTPDQQVMQRVIALCNEYDHYVEEAWKQEWEVCKSELGSCFEAAASGNHTEAGEMMGRVKEMIRNCHSRYK